MTQKEAGLLPPLEEEPEDEDEDEDEVEAAPDADAVAEDEVDVERNGLAESPPVAWVRSNVNEPSESCMSMLAD